MEFSVCRYVVLWTQCQVISTEDIDSIDCTCEVDITFVYKADITGCRYCLIFAFHDHLLN